MEHCEAHARHGGRCRRPAGWGTVHKGRGPCRLHGGCLPNVIVHYEQEAAVAFARAALGDKVSIDPLEAMVQSVQLAAGIVEYYRMQLSEHYRMQLSEIEDEPSPALTRAYRRALLDLSRCAATALKANVEERRSAMEGETANLIAGAIDRAAAPLELTRDERASFAQRVEEELKALVETPRSGLT